MYQKSTRKQTDDYFKALQGKSELLPAKETLVRILQFASAYHVEKTLPFPLSGIILN